MSKTFGGFARRTVHQEWLVRRTERAVAGHPKAKGHSKLLTERCHDNVGYKKKVCRNLMARAVLTISLFIFLPPVVISLPRRCHHNAGFEIAISASEVRQGKDVNFNWLRRRSCYFVWEKVLCYALSILLSSNKQTWEILGNARDRFQGWEDAKLLKPFVSSFNCLFGIFQKT